MRILQALCKPRLWQILTLVGASAAGLAVQLLLWPDAGKTVADRSYAYSFQQNFWSEALHDKFNRLARSGAAKEVWLSTGEKNLSEKYLTNLELYHFHLTELLRSLKHQGNTVSHILSDLERVHQKVFPELSEDRRDEIVGRYEAFQSMTEELFRRIKDVEDVSGRLRDVLAPGTEFPSEEARIGAAQEQVRLLSRLYGEEGFFMKPGADHFSFVRDYASASERMLPLYGELVEDYNRIVRRELMVKNFFIILIAVFGAYMAFVKEYRGLRSERSGKDGNLPEIAPGTPASGGDVKGPNSMRYGKRGH